MIAEADSAPFVGISGADRSQAEQQHVIKPPASAITVERPVAFPLAIAVQRSERVDPALFAQPVNECAFSLVPNSPPRSGRNRPELSWAKVRICPLGSCGVEC